MIATFTEVKYSILMSDATKADTDKATPRVPLGLPAPSDVPSGQDSNQTIKLDHLGPMIVNSDGTISRISNWAQLTQPERDRSLRLLAKRNNVRMEGLRQQNSNEAAQQ